MNIYSKLNQKQIKLLEEAGDIIEDREYSKEDQYNMLANNF